MYIKSLGLSHGTLRYYTIYIVVRHNTSGIFFFFFIIKNKLKIISSTVMAYNITTPSSKLQIFQGHNLLLLLQLPAELPKIQF